MADRYEPASFESKWRSRWKEADLFKTREEPGRPKFYGMDFFPYPSGAGLSVGHCRNYVPTDVICRMKAMQGYNVLHPMGFDAFGLPAENEAIKRKTHPAPMIEQYAATYKRQMELIGVSYDWSRSFKSCDPSYYKWTQWIFGLLYKRGLAYQKMASVNWDPIDKTVLADEEVIAGRAERSGALVEKKWIPQWFFKITDYAQRLIDDLDTIDWPEGIKSQQRNWIGRSEGVQFTMKVASESPLLVPISVRDEEGVGGGEKGRIDLESDVASPKNLSFDVFTTRIDTIFGVTFAVLSPEHALVDEIAKIVSPEYVAAIRAYQEQAKTISDADRTADTREKTGVFTGAYAINPVNEQEVPIWIADYVLATYGTGAIMAVPGHDDRDFAFAKQFDLEVFPVIAPEPGKTDVELPFVTKDGYMINSGPNDGMSVAEAQDALGRWIEALGIGERKIQYKLRDWLISRQRYWGCPIPIIHTKDGELQLVPDNQLPVELPKVDNYEPSGDGTSPLAGIEEFVNVTDLDGRLGRRETDTMGGFACSSWYFLRFCDPLNYEKAWSSEAANYWMPVDCYVGGAEHAVMHLLYARFWTKVLFDEGLVSVTEPFSRLQNQGQVLGHTPYRKPRAGETLGQGEEGVLLSYEEASQLSEDEVFYRWSRMSKSKGNVVTPDEAVESFGADALRLQLLFVAPFTADVQWKNEGMAAQARFLNRIFKLVEDLRPEYEPNWRSAIAFEELDEAARKVRRYTHQTIRKVTEDIDKFAFNTYVSTMMILSNNVNDVLKGVTTKSRALQLALSEMVESMVLLLAPGAPHSADELWETLGHGGYTFNAEWPTFDEALAAEDLVTIAVQVNGKLRDTFEIAVGASNEAHESAAKALPKIQGYLDGQTIRKTIVVPGKLVSFVI